MKILEREFYCANIIRSCVHINMVFRVAAVSLAIVPTLIQISANCINLEILTASKLGGAFFGFLDPSSLMDTSNAMTLCEESVDVGPI